MRLNRWKKNMRRCNWRMLKFGKKIMNSKKKWLGMKIRWRTCCTLKKKKSLKRKKRILNLGNKILKSKSCIWRRRKKLKKNKSDFSSLWLRWSLKWTSTRRICKQWIITFRKQWKWINRITKKNFKKFMQK